MKLFFSLILFAVTNTLAAQSLFKGDSTELNKVYLSKGGQENNTKWYNKEFNELKETDDGVYYHLQYIIDGNHIQKKVGTKTPISLSENQAY